MPIAEFRATFLMIETYEYALRISETEINEYVTRLNV